MPKIGVLIVACLGSAASAPPLREAQWLAPGADAATALAVSPGECLAPPSGPDDAYRVEIGRAAFKSPLLLGGQAARGGLSCASCHIDGRANPNFFLEGLSDRPGSADVSSSIFSKVRDDGAFNPVRIPSLIGIKGKAYFGETTRADSLKSFIESAVGDEFQGAPPPPSVVDGLVAYIEAMTPQRCPDAPFKISAMRDAEDVARALRAARDALRREDRAAADFLVLSAQSGLGRIHERFAGDRFVEEQKTIAALSARIGAQRRGFEAADIAALEREALALGARLSKVRGSLYDPEALKAALERAR
jgi:hypothetical protein